MLKLLRNLLNKHQPQRPLPISRFEGQVEPDTRRKLVNWLQLPETRLAVQVIERARPTVWVSDNQQATANRLHQLQGWEAYKNALLSLGEEPKPLIAVDETFPTDTEL